MSITNKGTITVTTGTGIHAQTGTGILNGVSGVRLDQQLRFGRGARFGARPVIEINNGSTQTATFTNTGTVTASLLAETASSVAIADNNGGITVNNSGRFRATCSSRPQPSTTMPAAYGMSVGRIRLEPVPCINNFGTINIAGITSFSAAGEPHIQQQRQSSKRTPNSSATINGAVTGSGTFSIGNRSQLEFGSSVALAQVSFAGGNGLLTVDSPSTFSATMTGFAVGDIINLLGVVVSGTTSTDQP